MLLSSLRFVKVRLFFLYYWFLTIATPPGPPIFPYTTLFRSLVAGDRRAKTFCHGYRADSPGPDSRDDPHRPRGASRWVRHHGPASHLRGRTGSPATTGAPTTTVTRLRP